MYHYYYKIYIFSDSRELEQEFTGLDFPEGLSFTVDTIPFHKFKSFFENAYSFQKNTILILHLPSDCIPDEVMACSEICTQIAADSFFSDIILCWDSLRIQALSSTQLLMFTEVWNTPFSDALMHYYYTNLIKRIKLERDLKMAQIYLDTTIDSIPDLVWYKDIRGAHLKVNDGFCEAVGKTKEECRGRGHYYIWDLPVEEYVKGEYVCLETEEIVLRDKKTHLFTERVKSKKGMRQFKTYKSPIFDEYGTMIGTMGIAHDVTEFDNVSAELEIILSSLPFAALVSDTEGKIVNVNDMFLKYFTMNLEEVLQQNYQTFCDNIFGDSFPAGQKNHVEVSLDFEEGELILEVQETAILDVFGNVVGCFCSYRDITEHKRHMDLMENYQNHLKADVKKQVKINQTFQQNMLISFADIISSRDMITGGHIKRTSKYVELLVNAMREDTKYAESMDESFVNHIYLSAPLHDIGKVSIPDAILLKPGKFIPSEYEIMKQHTNLGGDILDTIMPELQDSEYYRLSKDMAQYHHERWDGMGYPKGLKGEEIPLCARIMAISDVFDALTSERPYKTAFTLEKARRIILDGRGSHFDPELVDIFVEKFDLFGEAANEFNHCQ